MMVHPHHNFLLETGFQEILPCLDDSSIKLYRLNKTEMEETEIAEVAKAISNLINKTPLTLAEKLPLCPYLSDEAGTLSLVSHVELGDIYARFNHPVEAIAIYTTAGERQKAAIKMQNVYTTPHLIATRELIEKFRQSLSKLNESASASGEMLDHFELGKVFYEIGSKAKSPTYLNRSVISFSTYLNQMQPQSANAIMQSSNGLTAFNKVCTACAMLGDTELAESWQRKLKECS